MFRSGLAKSVVSTESMRGLGILQMIQILKYLFFCPLLGGQEKYMSQNNVDIKEMPLK